MAITEAAYHHNQVCFQDRRRQRGRAREPRKGQLREVIDKYEKEKYIVVEKRKNLVEWEHRNGGGRELGSWNEGHEL